MSPIPQAANPDAYGRLDVIIGEASFEAGKQSPVTILLRNPFDVPVEVIEIRGPRSYHLHEIEMRGTPQTPENPPTDSPQPGFLDRLTQRLGRVRLAEISFGGVKAQLP